MIELFQTYFPNARFDLLWDNTLATLIMLGSSWVFTILSGLIIGVILFLTSPNQLLENTRFYQIASLITNVLRSIPFIILIVVLLPITHKVMGTKYGIKGAIFPLIIGAAPFYAKLAENSFREVNRGVIDAALSMGTPLYKIITKVLLPEARPSLIASATITAILLLSFTAMAVAVGGQGLGALAVTNGYERNQMDLAYLALIIVVIIAQLIQFIGDKLVLYFTRD